MWPGDKLEPVYEGQDGAGGEVTQDACLARMFPDLESLTQDGRFFELADRLFGPLNAWARTQVTLQAHAAPTRTDLAMSATLDVLRFPLWGSRLIEASAGTGKTWTIAALYLRLVLGHPTRAMPTMGATGAMRARGATPRCNRACRPRSW